MTEREQIQSLEADLAKLIQRYVDEYDLTVASAIGVLHVKIIQLANEALNGDEE